MTLYALDDITDSFEATKAFLWPIDVGRWAKLALVVFFGGLGGSNPLQLGGGSPGGDVPETPGTPGISDGISSISGAELAIIGAILGSIVLLVIIFAVVGSIMEFIFVDSLRNERVRIRHYWGQQWRRGLRLFGFRVVLGIVTFGIIGLLGVVVLAPVVFDQGEFSLGLLFLAIPLGILLMIASGLINGFTTMFIVPIMMLEDRGVLSGWRRFWTTFTGQWKQYGAYALVAFVLQIAGGIAAGIATLIGALVIAIPFGIIGVLGFGLLQISQIAGWAVIALVAIFLVLGLIVLTLFVSVPVQTFIRYYALLVLGDTNEEFDIIPERRQTLRE